MARLARLPGRERDRLPLGDGLPRQAERVPEGGPRPRPPELQLHVFEGTTQEKVKALFDALEGALGPDLFRKVFPAVVTDRDVVFDDFASLEASADGTVRTRVFYADPGASNQKPSVENYNQQLRVAIPKKAVLDDCTQEDLAALASHMNSRLLSSISDRTPASLFAAAFGDEALAKLGIREIPANEVRLKPIAK